MIVKFQLTLFTVPLVTPLLRLLPVLSAFVVVPLGLAVPGDVERLLREVVLEHGQAGEDEAKVEGLRLLVHQDAGDGEVVAMLAEDDEQV